MKQEYPNPWVRTHKQKVEFERKQESKPVEQSAAAENVSDDQLSITLEITDAKEGDPFGWDIYPLNSTQVI